MRAHNQNKKYVNPLVSDPVRSNYEKTGGQKSRWNVPIKGLFHENKMGSSTNTVQRQV